MSAGRSRHSVAHEDQRHGSHVPRRRRRPHEAVGAPARTSRRARAPGGVAPTERPMPINRRMTITVGRAACPATLVDTRAAAAFQAMLPLTLDMTDLNANEKLHDLPRDLPGDPTNPGTIHTGDVML